MIGTDSKRRKRTSSNSQIDRSETALRGDLVRRYEMPIYQGKDTPSRNGDDGSTDATSDEVAKRRASMEDARCSPSDQPQEHNTRGGPSW